jgi:hypothetical protein
MSWYYGREKVKTYRPLKSIPSIETGRDSESRGNLELAADKDRVVGEELSQQIGPRPVDLKASAFAIAGASSRRCTLL